MSAYLICVEWSFLTNDCSVAPEAVFGRGGGRNTIAKGRPCRAGLHDGSAPTEPRRYVTETARAARDRSRLSSPDLNACVSATGEVAIQKIDRLDDPLRASVVARRELDHARALVLAEVMLEARTPRRAALELDDQVIELHVAVGDDERQLAVPAGLAADRDAVVVLAAAAVDERLAQHHPAAVVPHRGRRRDHHRRVVGVRPDLDARVAAARQVAIRELHEADRPSIVAVSVEREVDHVRSRAFTEVVAERGVPARTGPELDLEVDHLEIAVEHHERELVELAGLLATDLDAIAIHPAVAVDLALAEHHPAARVPDRLRVADLEAPDL